MPQIITFPNFTAAIALACAIAQGSAAPARAGEPPVPATVETTAEPAGMKVNIDPETGEFLDTPPAVGDGAAAPGRRAARPALVEEPSPVAGGGTMVHLDDRFQSKFHATAGPDGQPKVDCVKTLK